MWRFTTSFAQNVVHGRYTGFHTLIYYILLISLITVHHSINLLQVVWNVYEVEWRIRKNVKCTTKVHLMMSHCNMNHYNFSNRFIPSNYPRYWVLSLNNAATTPWPSQMKHESSWCHDYIYGLYAHLSNTYIGTKVTNKFVTTTTKNLLSIVNRQLKVAHP